MQPWLPVALAIAKDVSQFVGERASAKAQEKQNDELRRNTLAAREADLATIEARRTEEREAAASKLLEVQRQANQERSLAMVASAQAGQSGLSVRALLSDYLRRQLENNLSIQTNLSSVNSQLDRERKKVISDAASRVNMAPSVTNPSFLGGALKIGSNAYSTYRAFKPEPKAPTTPTPKTY